MAATLKADIPNRILDATAALLEQEGVEHITLASIAHSAKISKGTLYYYFSSKEDLLFAVSVRYLDHLANDLMKWIEDESKDTSLHRLISYVLDRGAHGSHARLHFYLMHNILNGPPELREKFVEKYREWRALLSEKIAHRVVPDMQLFASSFASLLLTLIDGIITQNLILNETHDIQSFSYLLSFEKEMVHL